MKRIPFVLLVIVFFIGCPNHKEHKPDIPEIIGPLQDTLYTRVFYGFSAYTTDPDGDSVAYYFDWGDETSDSSDFLFSGDTATFSHSYSDTGEYTLRVIAMDNTIDSLLSDTAEYPLRITRPPGAPPKKPAIDAEIRSGYINISYAFYAQSRDPDDDSISYRFNWGDGSTSNWSGYVPSGTEVSMYHSYSDAGNYSVTAQAKDIYGQESEWSFGVTIVIEVGNRPPYTPDTVLAPVRGVVGDTYTFSVYTTDPDEDRVKYIINWWDGSLDSSYFVSSGDTVSFAHSYSIEGEYDIIAVAIDEYGARSEWSPPHTIVISKLGYVEDKVKVGEIGRSSIAIGPGDTLYVGSLNTLLYAISPLPALQSVWPFATGGKIESSPLIDSDASVYVGSGNGCLYKILPGGYYGGDAETGGTVLSSPAMDAQGNIYIGSNDGNLYCIDQNCNILWKYKTDGGIESSPAIDAEGNIYFGSNDGNIYSLSKGGSRRWKYPTGGSVRSSPAIGNGRVYVGSDDFHLYCISTGGDFKWRYKTKTSGKVISSPAIGPDGKVYVGSDQGDLYCLDQSGKEVWPPVAVGAASIYSSPAIASDGTVYVGTHGGVLCAVSSDGTIWWRCEVGGSLDSSPIINPGGSVYIGSSNGYVYKIKGSAGPATGVWPMFRHDYRHTGRVGGL